MKRIFILAAALLVAASAFAQTPDEIISRMESVIAGKQKDGVVMTMDMKIPIVGTISSTSYILGEKLRVEAEMKGEKMVEIINEDTEWSYDSKSDQVTIDHRKKSDDPDGQNEMDMFTGVTEGYDVTLSKETDDAWYLLGKKSRTNKNKDDPKTMDIVVAKATYYPLRLSAKMSGVTLTLRDISFGVPESLVTFNAADFPGAKIVDKRQ